MMKQHLQMLQLFMLVLTNLEMYETFKCTSRYEFRNLLSREFEGCASLIKKQPICGEPISVSYSEHPPYIWKDGNRVVGILPGMLQDAIDTCCYGCTNVTYQGPYDDWEKFKHEDVSLLLPIQTSINNEIYFGHNFVHMVQVKGVTFFGRPIQPDPNKTIWVIFRAVFNTWPLFTIAFAMAVVAGIIIWLLDNRLNTDEFPDFPQGIFEGFWWAVVSMTTVGYGDRSPKSFAGRSFAVLWIVVGITIFSMYTATLTSTLTTAVISQNQVSLYQSRIGVLETTTVGKSATIQINANPKAYHSVGELIDALINNEVEFVGLDDNIANHFLSDFAKKGLSDVTLYDRATLNGFSYGMITTHHNITELFKSFYESNDEQRDTMARESLRKYIYKQPIKTSSVVENNNLFTSTKIFVSCLLSLVIVAILLIVIGLLLKRFKYLKKPRSKKLNINDEQVAMTKQPSAENDEMLLELIDQLRNQILNRKN